MTDTDSGQRAPSKGKLAPPGVFVVFGASGDLTSRKLMPALAGLVTKNLLPDGVAVVGIGRTPMSDDEFRNTMRATVPDAGPEWDTFVGKMRYITGEYDEINAFDRLKQVLKELDDEQCTGHNRT